MTANCPHQTSNQNIFNEIIIYLFIVKVYDYIANDEIFET